MKIGKNRKLLSDSERKRFLKSIKVRSGKLIEPTKNISKTSKVKVRCNECNFIWSATPSNLFFCKRTTWCPNCSGHLSKEQRYLNLVKIAKINSGQVLSPKYIGYSKSMKFSCIKHGEFSKLPSLIFKNGFCKKCLHDKLSEIRRNNPQNVKAQLSSLGWKLISGKYINQNSNLKLKCKLGHYNTMTLKTARKGAKCSICSHEKSKTEKQLRWNERLEELKKIAKSRNGECLSHEFKGDETKLKWRHECGYTWTALPSVIERGSWCLKCSTGLSERLARTALEQIFNSKFNPASPGWLVNTTGKRLTLDGFNKKLKIAFEHQGAQHFSEHNSHFHRDNSFLYQLKKDKLKRALCKENGVRLLEIPELIGHLPLKLFKPFIKKELERSSIAIPVGFNDLEIDWSKAYVRTDLVYLNQITKIANQRNGKLISNYYLGDKYKLQFKCENQFHPIFLLSPGKLKSGRWCKLCGIEKRADKKRISLSVITKIIEEKGGTYISSDYKNQRSKIKFRCKRNHTREMNAGSIYIGKWCKACSSIERRKKT